MRRSANLNSIISEITSSNMVTKEFCEILLIYNLLLHKPVYSKVKGTLKDKRVGYIKMQD